MCEVCHKWQPELGIQENELCLFEAFAFKSRKVLSASRKVMLSLLSASSRGSVQLAGFSLEKAYLPHGALWGTRGVGAHDMLPVLSYVSRVWCLVCQKSQVWLRSTGVTAVETESRGERQQCRQQGRSLTQRSGIVSLEAKRCLRFHEACIIFPASEVLFSVFLCPTSAGAHSVLQLKRLEVNVTTARRMRPPHWSLALKREHLCTSDDGLCFKLLHEAPGEPWTPYWNLSRYLSPSLCGLSSYTCAFFFFCFVSSTLAIMMLPHLQP